jgi:hypothetical protein
MKIVGCGSGSISQRHGSVDPQPDLNQNVLDPQHRNSHYFVDSGDPQHRYSHFLSIPDPYCRSMNLD